VSNTVCLHTIEHTKRSSRSQHDKSSEAFQINFTCICIPAEPLTNGTSPVAQFVTRPASRVMIPSSRRMLAATSGQQHGESSHRHTPSSASIYMTPSESRHSYDVPCILDLICHRKLHMALERAEPMRRCHALRLRIPYSRHARIPERLVTPPDNSQILYVAVRYSNHTAHSELNAC
jgi:hypothetical protein